MRTMSIRTLLTLLGRSATALAMAAGLAVFAAPAEPTDADFVIARDAFRANDASRLDRIAPRLKGHLLESYVEYWQLRLNLDDADPERVRSFLTRREGGPLADRLRGEWLKSLAKRGEWTLFAAEYPKRAGDDTELSCYAMQWQRIREGDAALDLARPLWFSGQEQPESCQTLFAALLTLGKLTSQDVWMRFRQAHEAGSFRLAVRLLDLLPADERPAQRDVTRVDRNPAQALGKGDFRWSSRSGRELALYALDRAANRRRIGARRLDAMALARFGSRAQLRQSAGRLQRGAPVAAFGECLVSRGAGSVARRATASVAGTRGASFARLGRRSARDRRDA